MAHILVWDKENFNGDSAEFFAESRNLQNQWGGRTSSFEILSGYWRFYEHIEFGGLATAVFGPGRYSDVRDYAIPDDFISSMQYLGEKLYLAGRLATGKAKRRAVRGTKTAKKTKNTKTTKNTKKKKSKARPRKR
jgi:Beta/Gamma crystallin